MNTIIMQCGGVPETLLTIDRIGIIIFLLSHSVNLDGDIAEVGTYKAGVGHYLNKFSNGKRVLLFDTFTGIPIKSEIDTHLVGDFNDSNYEQVKEHFKNYNNVKVIQGLFPDSVGSHIKESDRFCFVHIDVDQYQSTIDSLNFFYNKIVTGGVIVFDDYGHLAGVDKAINDFFSDKPEKPIQGTFMQCFIFKN